MLPVQAGLATAAPAPHTCLAVQQSTGRGVLSRRSGGAEQLVDGAGRSIRYLRLSVTQACNMRCACCRAGRMCATPDEVKLSAAEIEGLIRYLTETRGLRKVRVTGGEPTCRVELGDIMRRVAAVPGVRELVMTTNGLTLAERATELAEAGLQRVNVSLDALTPARFARLTGVDGVDRVVAGIDAALRSGLAPLRLNTVVMRGLNEEEVVPLARFAAERGVEIRYIELMPIAPASAHHRAWHVSTAQVMDTLRGSVVAWQALTRGRESAQRHRVTLDDGTAATMGFISSMSDTFCARCDRLRVAADGTLYPCLMGRPAGSMLPGLRPVRSDALLKQTLTRALARKSPNHCARGFTQMTVLGG